MAVWNKKSTLYTAISDWQKRGLLDDTTAEKLTIDLATQSSGKSFQTVLILLAVICLGFAAITFVAANWEDISRLTRVIIIIGSMWAAWGASVVFHSKGRGVLAQSFVLLACILFGAGIMLISQIYHMQGEPRDAVLLWMLGTLLGSALTRSVPALSFGIILLNIWSLLDNSPFSGHYEINLVFLGFLAIAAGLAFWMRSRFAGFLALFSLSGWIFFTAIAKMEQNQAAFLVINLYLGFVLLSATLFSEGARRFLQGFENTLAAFFLFNIGTLSYFQYFIGQFENATRYDDLFSRSLVIPAIAVVITGAMALLAKSRGNENSYDLIVIPIAVALTGAVMSRPGPVPFISEALLLALSIWVIRMGWRMEYRPITFLGFLGFALMMITIYFITIGTLIGSSAFYLGAGLLLLLGVYLAPKLLPGAKGAP